MAPPPPPPPSGARLFMMPLAFVVGVSVTGRSSTAEPEQVIIRPRSSSISGGGGVGEVGVVENLQSTTPLSRWALYVCVWGEKSHEKPTYWYGGRKKVDDDDDFRYGPDCFLTGGKNPLFLLPGFWLRGRHHWEMWVKSWWELFFLAREDEIYSVNFHNAKFLSMEIFDDGNSGCTSC